MMSKLSSSCFKVISNSRDDITHLGIWKLVGLQNGSSFNVTNLGCNNLNNVMCMLCSRTFSLLLMCKPSKIDAYIYNWCKYIQHVHLLSSLLQNASSSNNAMSKIGRCTLWSMDHHKAWSTTWGHYSGESIYLFCVACHNLCKISKEKISNQFCLNKLFVSLYVP
jgi:hypothetical protein